jgi:hypothetical protein
MAFLAASLRYGELNHLVTVGSIIPLRRATSSRYDERLRQQTEGTGSGGWIERAGYGMPRHPTPGG